MAITKNITFYSYDLMPCGAAKMSSILKYFQQLARDDLDTLGYTYEKLFDMGVVFVLSKIKVLFDEPIFENENIEIRTAQRTIKGATFIRDFAISKNDQVIGRASSYWVLIDFKSRKICRPSILDDLGCGIDMGYGVEAERFIDTDGEYIKADERKVRFSDADQNRHLNNTIYADIATDCTDYYEKNVYVSDIQINFEGEAVPGETIDLETSFDGIKYYIRGTVEKRKCFEAKLEFKPI